MTGQADIAGRSDEIFAFIEGGELGLAIKKALDFMRDFADPDGRDECVLLSFDFKTVDGAMRQDKLSGKASLVERRRIAAQLLKLIRHTLNRASLEATSG